MIARTAEHGVFNMPNMSPMHSAFNADLYEALYYLSYKKEEAQEQ